MRPEYGDLFMRNVRFLLICNLCGSAIAQETIELHDNFHLFLEGLSNDTRGAQPEG